MINTLKPSQPKTPIFYILPKTHKQIRPPPGRPIVASIGAPTEKISAFIDDILQPFVKNLPSYIKNSNHFLERLAEIPQPLPKDVILVTIDVVSLYTNIPHDEGIKAIEHFLEKRPKGTLPTTGFLTKLIAMILTMNNFTFMNKHFLQKKGTAMGTKMAPSYANLFMGLCEQTFLLNQNLQPLAWYRFIDDIFLVWQSGMESLQLFLKNLNTFFSSLNFTWNISQNSVTFLDVDVFLDNGVIKTKVHVKDTNKMQYLHYESCHPKYIKNLSLKV